MNETTTPASTPPTPAAGSAVDDICDALVLLNGRVSILLNGQAIKEHASRMGACAAQDFALAVDALNQAVKKVRMIERKVAVAEMAMRSIRCYPCGHKPSGVGGHCEACEALKRWDDSANPNRSGGGQ